MDFLSVVVCAGAHRKPYQRAGCPPSGNFHRRTGRCDRYDTHGLQGGARDAFGHRQLRQYRGAGDHETPGGYYGRAITDSYEQVKQTIIRSGFSRIPVYEGDLDNIKGTLYVKDLLSHIDRGDEFGWQQLIRRPYFVPEHKKINDLLADFQNQKIHMAIVVDEYGSTQGLVSLEDIVEEVVGEISDESDKDEVFYTRLDKDTYLFDGKTHIGDFERIVEIAEGTFADVKGRAETLAGLMLELKCDFLKKGDTVTAHGVRFTVEEIEGHRIDKIKVRLHG